MAPNVGFGDRQRRRSAVAVAQHNMQPEFHRAVVFDQRRHRAFIVADVDRGHVFMVLTTESRSVAALDLTAQRFRRLHPAPALPPPGSPAPDTAICACSVSFSGSPDSMRRQKRGQLLDHPAAHGRFNGRHVGQGDGMEESAGQRQQHGHLFAGGNRLILWLFDIFAHPTTPLEGLSGVVIQPGAEAREYLQFLELGVGATRDGPRHRAIGWRLCLAPDPQRPTCPRPPPGSPPSERASEKDEIWPSVMEIRLVGISADISWAWVSMIGERSHGTSPCPA